MGPSHDNVDTIKAWCGSAMEFCSVEIRLLFNKTACEVLG